VAALDPVNAAADAAPGFVWRLQAEDGNATAVRALEWDAAGSAGVIVNMPVWESADALAAFVYSGYPPAGPAPAARVVRADDRGLHGSMVDHARDHPYDERG
jgi:hypothetical protein